MKRAPKKKQHRQIIGIDGEGLDTLDGRHLYTYLAAVDDEGTLVADARNPEGLTHDECMNLILSLPKKALVFGFSLGYDYTKMLETMPPSMLYELVRPEVRKTRTCKDTKCKERWVDDRILTCPKCGGVDFFESFRPIRYNDRSYSWSPFAVADSWYNPAQDDTYASLAYAKAAEFFRAGFRHARFGAGSLVEVFPTVDKLGFPFVRARFGDELKQLTSAVLVTAAGRFVPPPRKNKKRKAGWQRRMRVWDCFKFFQQSFVRALESWDVGTPKEREQIQRMKEQRGRFRTVSDAQKEKYCQNECRLLATLMRKLVDAHDEVGLTLKRYDSPGSTAAVLLAHHKVDEFAGPRINKLPKRLARAIRCAYFGGRFETSCIGIVEDKLYGRDINAAYPYALTHLPCLRCGLWRHVKGAAAIRKAVRGASAALCRFRVRELGTAERKRLAWGPLPCRTTDGSIVFGTNFSGWAWWQELGPALDGWPGLVELGDEAWIYRTTCKHQPFKWMPERYRNRCEWGSTGKGLVMKNGTNSVYGKLAQSLGSEPRFQQWAWAGMCTATTRGQMVEAIATLPERERWHVRSIATDGLVSTRPLKLAEPRDTGTADCVNDKGKSKVLGAWDVDDYDAGALFVKPGMLIPIDPKLKAKIRARGVGRKYLETHRDPLFQAWERWDRKTYDEPLLTISLRKFHGLKGSLHAISGCSYCGRSWIGHISVGCQNEKCKAFGSCGDFTRTGYNGHYPACSKACIKRAEKDRRAGHVLFGCGKLLKTKIDGTTYRWKCLQPFFGTWAPVSTGIAFEPLPKRERCVEQEGTFSRLFVRDLGGIESLGYAGKTTPEGLEAREARDTDLDQADAGLDAEEWEG